MDRFIRVLAFALAAFAIAGYCRDLPVSSTIGSFLSTNGLPAGLFPTAGIEKFEVRTNGTFLVELRDVCQSKELDEEGLFFDSRISGSFGHGKMYDMYGVGMFEHKLPITRFQDEIVCDKRTTGNFKHESNDTSSFFEDYVYGVFRRAFGGI
ncbi:hypothetical protein SELMODRAFT_412960 [Selaginella moellendorffii]|uniref:Uncharacterized protein n=1 Tax=Selaginella moellendorffii TaxID=88036 RepID=D8RMW9_SELML|nr:hypothetical protein SELMODRAFT_412960 [Selaginella moellendorffii]